MQIQRVDSRLLKKDGFLVTMYSIRDRAHHYEKKVFPLKSGERNEYKNNKSIITNVAWTIFTFTPMQV